MVKRLRSFEDILDQRLSSCPETPELCGIQGILPRQAGVRVVKEVGAGSFAKVVLAVNKRNHVGAWTDRRVKRKLFHGAMLREGQRIVMKCIQKGLSAEEDQAIQRELSIHGRLVHPNIAACHGCYEDARHMVMLLDFIEGRELKDVLRMRRSLGEEEACPLMLQAMRAVAYMHAMEVVHRDISPRNFLVTDTGRLYVIDFGLAVDLNAGMAHVAPGAGTMGYQAPEILQAQGVGASVEAIVRPSNDVWAVGTILYESVFGFAPFLPRDLYTPGGVEVMFPDENYGPLPSPEIQDLLSSLLKFDASCRLDAASALLHPWFAPAVLPLDARIKEDEQLKVAQTCLHDDGTRQGPSARAAEAEVGLHGAAGGKVGGYEPSSVRGEASRYFTWNAGRVGDRCIMSVTAGLSCTRSPAADVAASPGSHCLRSQLERKPLLCRSPLQVSVCVCLFVCVCLSVSVSVCVCGARRCNPRPTPCPALMPRNSHRVLCL